MEVGKEYRIDKSTYERLMEKAGPMLKLGLFNKRCMKVFKKRVIVMDSVPDSYGESMLEEQEELWYMVSLVDLSNAFIDNRDRYVKII